MAKQTGPKFFIGTIGMTCFYKRGSQYLMRTKSSLTAEMVKESSRFANTRKSARELATASRLASEVYRNLPKGNRKVILYRKMTGMAKVMLKEGYAAHVIICILKDHAGDRLVNRQLPMVNRKGWRVNKEGRLEPYPAEALKSNFVSPMQKERKRYFKLLKRSVIEIVDPVNDDIFLALVDFLGFKRPVGSRRIFRDNIKKKVKCDRVFAPVVDGDPHCWSLTNNVAGYAKNYCLHSGLLRYAIVGRWPATQGLLSEQ